MTDNLTPDQRGAIEQTRGNLVISAGAGSGKTTVLARRFARAVSEGNEIDQLLTITFTSKAAAEVAERVRKHVNADVSTALGRRVDEAWISTIHRLCGRLVRRHCLEAGLEPGFGQTDEAQSAILKAEAFDRVLAAHYGSDAGITAFVTGYGYDRAYELVMTVHEQARSMGLDPADAVAASGWEQAPELLREVTDCAQRLAEALAAGPSTPACDRNQAIAERHHQVFSACAMEGMVDVTRALEALEVSDPTSSGQEEAREARKALVSAKKTFRCACEGRAAEPMLRGLEQLIGLFSEEYTRVKRERSTMDFDDLQEFASRLFETNPDIAKRYRDHFKAIMVDEFQDTNDLQMRVLGYLRNDDLCVVGDKRQSIYGFRYADVEIFDRVADEIDSRIELKSNFRSHPEVLSFVNGVFSQSELFGPSFMQLEAGKHDGWKVPLPAGAPHVECYLAGTDDSKMEEGRELEAELIAQRAAALVAQGTEPGQIAVLLRASTRAATYAQAMERAGLPVYVQAGQLFHSSREVAEMVALLRVIALPSDDEALVNVLAGRLVGLSDDALFTLRTEAGKHGHLFPALERAASAMRKGDRDAALHAARTLDVLRRAHGSKSLSALIHSAAEAFDYDLTLFAEGKSGLRAWANILKLVRFAEEFERAESPDPGAFFEHMRRLATESPRESAAATESGVDAVRIMTIHGSKGLEFPVVFVADLGIAIGERGDSFLVGRSRPGPGATPTVGVKLPSNDGSGTATLEYERLKAERSLRDVEEEKRCLYVACTRARELLVVSAACPVDSVPETPRYLIDWIRLALAYPHGSGPATVGGAEVSVVVERADAGAERIAAALPVRSEDDAVFAARAEETPTEKPRPELPPTVSFSGLSLYSKCSLAYYARSVLGLRQFAAEPASALGLGSAVHACLQHAGVDGVPATVRDAAIRRFGLDSATVERLDRAVSGYLRTPLADRVARADRVAHEEPLRTQIGDEQCAGGGRALVGAIDLIAWEGDHALIVDYKTGEAPPAGGVDPREADHRLQAECYAVAALDAGAHSVEVVFAFVEHGDRTISFEFGTEDHDRIREELGSRLEEMARGVFAPLPRFDANLCHGCPALGGVCPVDDPRPKTSGR